MAGIDFPSNPNVNQQHTAFGNVWFWNGESWRKAGPIQTQGAQGNAGTPGAQGHQGLTGSGAQGATGAQGDNGAQGAIGTQGAQGHQGFQGTTGAQGVQGQVGGGASITSQADPPTGANDGDLWWDSDEGPLLLYYNDGNSSQWVDISTGPMGAQGAQGTQGSRNNLEVSENAPSSPSAGDLWWESDTGILSVYYDDGVGSPSSQWVEIGSGPTGAQGAQGTQGSQGTQGTAGAQGSQGHQGTTGAQGSQGHQGNDGAQASAGAQGDNGAQGSQGHQGLTGAQGNVGAQGSQGHQGQSGTNAGQGAQGDVGAQGAQGHQGLTGAQGNVGAQGTSGANVGGSAGQVVFKNSSNVTAGSDDLVFDDANNRLGIGTVAPTATLNVTDADPVFRLSKVHGTNSITTGDIKLSGGGNLQYSARSTDTPGVHIFTTGTQETELLRLQGSSGVERIGIRTDVPLRTVHVESDDAEPVLIRSSASEVFVGFICDGQTNNGRKKIGNIGDNLVVENNFGTEDFRIHDDGEITAPRQPAFKASRTAGTSDDSGSNATKDFMEYNSTSFNIGNSYSTSTFRFTAPVAGRYFFYASTRRAQSNNGWHQIMKNNSDVESRTEIRAENGDLIVFGSALVDMAVNDYVNIRANNTQVLDTCFFGGYLVS